MSESLLTFLHGYTRSWDTERGQWVVDTPVARLVAEIEALCTVHGLSLSRWQSSKAKWIVRITYAIHYGARTTHFRHLYHPLYYVTLNNREGKTEACEAYRKLSTILSYLHSIGEPNHENSN